MDLAPVVSQPQPRDLLTQCFASKWPDDGEYQLLRLVGDGWSVTEAAEIMGVHYSTAYRHIEASDALTSAVQRLKRWRMGDAADALIWRGAHGELKDTHPTYVAMLGRRAGLPGLQPEQRVSVEQPPQVIERIIRRSDEVIYERISPAPPRAAIEGTNGPVSP